MRVNLCIAVVLVAHLSPLHASDAIEFNTEILDIKDRKNIDLSQFSHGDYIMPGSYALVVRINKTELPEQQITFYAPANDPKSSVPCLTRPLVEKIGVKEDVFKTLTWDEESGCLLPDSLKGMEARGDLGTSTLYLNVPQAYLDYVSDNWDPPALWDNGIPGMVFDYNVNAQAQRQTASAVRDYNVSGNGTLGANVGAWRLRADWQGRFERQRGAGSTSTSHLDWSRYYLYRALPSLRAKLVLGESYMDSGLFDSFRFAGVSVNSDDNMLPPNLRGYAPEVVGVAKTNAKVTIRQQDRVLYETQVAAGPFRIQDISDAVSGELDVRVEEQDGSVQAFKVNTANIPYLTRPGSLRFKTAAGRPSNSQHHTNGPLFGTGEFSWGVSNGWSLYGGSLAGGDYNAVALGIGRDLMVLGALSFDATQSRASLSEDGTTMGGSWRLSYSKNFDEYDSQVTFAGYRFSQKGYMSMSEYLDARDSGSRTGASKEMYTVRLSKQFSDLKLSAFADYTHQTYWDRPANNRYNLNLARYFDIGRFKDINLSITAQRSEFNRAKDDSIYLGLSLPWGSYASLSYSANSSRNGTSHQLGYFNRVDEHNSYNLTSGFSDRGGMSGVYYTHEGDIAQTSANASYQSGQYSAVGLSAQGGATLTAQGGALHRAGTMGGTRMLLDTQGVAGVPVHGFGSTTNTNRFGKAVVADVSSYYRNRASIDLDQLGDDVEASDSVVQETLTEGAIGYRAFNVIAGSKAMATIRLADGSSPPFGAVVINARRQQTGIVNDDGNTYLSGIKPAEIMTVNLGADSQCEITFPSPLPKAMLINPLLLPCHPIAAGDSKAKA